jgi:hypothetical protein
MKASNIFDNRADAEAYLKLAGPQFEILIWTNKYGKRQYSVIRKRSSARGRRKGHL